MRKCQRRKIVEAAKITNIHPAPEGADTVSFETEGGERHILDAAIVARGMFARGDYLVLYESGHLSWLPYAVFEAGYALEENSGE